MNQLQHLARVSDEDLAGRASGAGARALLASVTAEEPVTLARTSRARAAWSRPRRLLAGAVAVAGVVAAAVAGPAVLGGGQATSYANAAIDIELRGDYYVAVIKDPLADHAKYTEGFKAVGLDVKLELVPATPTAVGEVTGFSSSFGDVGHPAGARSIGSGTEPSGCRLGTPGCAMTILVQHDYDASAVVQVGRVAQPGEKYENARPATWKGEMLEGFRVDEKPVGEVLAEVRKRGLKAVFEVITPSPGNDGWTVEADRQSAEVGDDWIVWEAQSEQAGVVRLMVTKDRLPQNPIYAGPKPPDPTN